MRFIISIALATVIDLSNQYYSKESNPLFPVVVKNKQGFIDKSGKIVIKPIYESASEFSDGLAVVKINGKYGYINKNGKLFIQPIFYSNSPFSNGVATARISDSQSGSSSGYGLIDKKMNWIVKPDNKLDIDNFSEGLAAVIVKNKNKIGFINTHGKWVINPVFEMPSYYFQIPSYIKFSEGLAAAMSNHKWVTSTKTGNGLFVRNMKAHYPFMKEWPV